MKLQSDSVLVFDLVKERDKFLARLATAEEKPVIGGWEELFLSTIKVISHEGDESENDGEETENEWEFHGMKLKTRTRRRRRHHLYVPDSRTIEAVRNEILLSLKNFLSERLHTDEWKALAPLAQLRVDVSDVELRAYHNQFYKTQKWFNGVFFKTALMTMRSAYQSCLRNADKEEFT